MKNAKINTVSFSLGIGVHPIEFRYNETSSIFASIIIITNGQTF